MPEIYLTDDFDPVGHWKFNGDLTDSSGNGVTMTAVGGDPSFAHVVPGTLGLCCDGNVRVSTLVNHTHLNLEGPMTASVIVVPGGSRSGSAAANIFSHDGPLDNYIYNVRGVPNNNGSGTDTGGWCTLSYRLGLSTDYTTTVGLTRGVPQLITFTRASNGTLTWYINGLYRTTMVATTALGAGTGYLNVGSNSGGTDIWLGIVCSLKLIDAELTASEVEQEYDSSLGTLFPRVTA